MALPGGMHTVAHGGNPWLTVSTTCRIVSGCLQTPELAMHTSPHQHIATVMQVAADGVGAQAAARHEQVIRDSWLRCVQQHRLDPTRMQEAIILPQARLREHQDQMEALLHIARHGLESLYTKVAGLGYVVLLTDARGVTVDFLGDLVL